MAMNLGRGRLLAHINVTPMADIMIVLLIIFMVTVPMMDNPDRVRLPIAGHAREGVDGRVVLTLRADGTVLVDQEASAGGPGLELTLARRFQGQAPEARTVLVQADDALPYDAVREALRACRDAGAATVMLRANTLSH
jgi:biopolymer transport protein ExbD